mgnify:CR=1 FL=1
MINSFQIIKYIFVMGKTQTEVCFSDMGLPYKEINMNIFT